MKKLIVFGILILFTLTLFSGCIDISPNELKGSWSNDDTKYTFNEDDTGTAYRLDGSGWIRDYDFTYGTTSEKWMWFQIDGTDDKISREYYFLDNGKGLVIYEPSGPVLYEKET